MRGSLHTDRSTRREEGMLVPHRCPGAGRFLISMTLGVATLVSAVALAFAAGGDGGEDAHGGNWIDFLWRMANFIILIGAIAWLLAKRVKSFFSDRREGIRTALAEAEAARAQAEKRYQETTAKLDRATSEIAQIGTMIKAQGKAQKARIIEDAKRAAEKIKEDTQARMEQEFAKAAHQLRTEAVHLSVAMAEEILRKNIQKEDHETLVRDYIDKVVTRH